MAKNREKQQTKTEGLTVVVETQRYKTVPVDLETHERLMALCEVHGFGKRGQGAMVRKLVKTEYEIMLSNRVLPKGQSKKAVHELPEGE